MPRLVKKQPLKTRSRSVAVSEQVKKVDDKQVKDAGIKNNRQSRLEKRNQVRKKLISKVSKVSRQKQSSKGKRSKSVQERTKMKIVTNKKVVRKVKATQKSKVKQQRLETRSAKTTRLQKTRKLDLIEISDDSEAEEVNKTQYLGKRSGHFKKIANKRMAMSEYSSPMRSILKTSPIYSPIKTSSKKPHITIREQDNIMKNFLKDRSNSRESQLSKPHLPKTSPFRAEEIAKVSSQLIVPVRLNQIKSVLKSKESLNSSKSKTIIEFSQEKPSYVNHRFGGGEGGRGLSPIRMLEHNSPRLFFNDIQQI